MKNKAKKKEDSAEKIRYDMIKGELRRVYFLSLPLTSDNGGIGRRDRLRIYYREVCRFDSCLSDKRKDFI